MLLDKYKKKFRNSPLKSRWSYYTIFVAVREEYFLNKMCVSNNEIAMFNQNLLKMAEEYAGCYLDSFDKFVNLPASEDYIDDSAS